MAQSQPSRSKNIILYGLGVAALVLIAFSPCLSAQFLNWDDPSHFLKNPYVLRFDLIGMFREIVLQVYVPLTTLSFAAERWLYGFSPFMFHLDNILLHIGVTLLGFGLALRLGITTRASFLGALIFGLHPMHVESVAWLTERKDVLYSVFYLGALLVWWTWQDPERNETGKPRSIGYLCVAFLLALLSLLSKPMALSLPLAMVLLAWFRGVLSRRNIMAVAPFFILTVAIVWQTYAHHARNPLGPPVQSVLIWLWTTGFYIWKFFWPMVLHPLYDIPQPVGILSVPYLATIILLAFVGYFLWKRRRDRWLMFAALWFFLSIFFLLRFDTKDIHVVADRFMYLPSLGLCLWLGTFADEKLTAAKTRRAAAVILAAGLVLLGGKTFLQCRVWKNNETLWTYVIRHHPYKELAYNNRAVAYAEQGQYALAVRDYTEVLTFAQNKALAYYNRGLVFRDWADSLRKKKATTEEEKYYRLAIADLTEAIRIDPNFVKTYNHRGLAHFWIGERAEAIADLTSAVARDPNYVEAFNNRGNVYADLGDLDKAYADYTRTIELDPSFARGFNNRGIILARKGRRAQALEQLTRAIELDPGISEAYFNRSMLRNQEGDVVNALDDALRAKALGVAVDEGYIQSLKNKLR